MKNLARFSDYVQPSFYRFSEDSVILAKIASAQALVGKQSLNVIDVCSGCGVVGLEFYQKVGGIVERLDFCEIQPEFIPYLLNNVNKVIKDKSVHRNIFNVDFNKLKDKSDSHIYDIILCNPPYFHENNHRKSQNLKKQLCRFYTHGLYDDLAQFIWNHLRPGSGVAFILAPPMAVESLNWSQLNFKILQELKQVNIYQIKKI